MTPEQWTKLRDELIIARDSLFSNFDPAGLVILSHAIRYCSFKQEGKEYEPEP